MKKKNPAIRAVGIIIQDNQLLIMERERGEDQYFVFPGGGVEEGETVEEAVVRELREEASIEVELEKLIYKLYLDGGKSELCFYLCSYVKGEPKLNYGNEKDRMGAGTSYYRPQWIALNKISKINLYPLEIRDWLLEDIKKGFKNTPREEHLKISDLRQK